MELELETGWLDQHPLLRGVINILQSQQIEAYLVGGAVRDLLLSRDSTVDLDFAVPGDGLAVARQVANIMEAAVYPLDAERGTGRVVIDRPETFGVQKTYLDFASLRGETLEADLHDRDFTVNAMALSVTDPPRLIDPCAGRRDLEAKMIRAVSAVAFQHDPVRVLRAVRQAVELGFSIEAETEYYLMQAAAGLVSVSWERQRDELVKLLNSPRPGQAIELLRRFGLLPYILPEVKAMVGVSQSAPHYLDVFEHTRLALDIWADMQSELADVPAKAQAGVRAYLNEDLSGNLTPQLLLPLALLWHDTGKPLTRTINGEAQERIRFLGHEAESAKMAHSRMKRLHFSNQAIGFVEKIVLHHMRPLLLANEGKLSRRAIYRLFRDSGSSNFQAGVAVALHALADHRATYPPGQGQAEEERLLGVVQTLIMAFFEQRERVIDPPPLLKGRDLIDRFNLREGRLMGLLLNRLKEAQAAGQVQTEAEAVAFIEADQDFMAYQDRTVMD